MAAGIWAWSGFGVLRAKVQPPGMPPIACTLIFLHVISKWSTTKTNIKTMTDQYLPYSDSHYPSDLSIFSDFAYISESTHLQIFESSILNLNHACSRPTPHNTHFRQRFGSQLGDYKPGLAVVLAPLSSPTNPTLTADRRRLCF